MILKPSPLDIQDMYLESLVAIGTILKARRAFRRGRLGIADARRLGPRLAGWLDGMEITQFTYFQQVAGIDCRPGRGELTYGLERIAMYLQDVDRVFDLNFNGREGANKVTYGDVFLQAEKEYSRHNFEHADTTMLFEQFKMAEAACQKYLKAGWQENAKGPGHNQRQHLMALPAFDQCIKASHAFNLLDARGPLRNSRTRPSVSMLASR